MEKQWKDVAEEQTSILVTHSIVSPLPMLCIYCGAVELVLLWRNGALVGAVSVLSGGMEGTIGWCDV